MFILLFPELASYAIERNELAFEYVLKTSYITTARAREVAFAINPEVPKWCEENGVQLLTYADL